MALTDDQRAMLRLLAQNDESYEDIAALKGVSVEQVRVEVKAALTAAAAEEVSVPASPKAAEATPPPVEPAAEKPVAPPPPEERAAKPETTPRRPRKPLPPERRRLLMFAGGALAVVAAVLILVAALGGGSDDSGSQASEGGSAAGQAASAENAKLTQAKLEPVGGGDAEGQAVFGRLKKKIILLVEAVGLGPTPQGSSYTVWLYKSPELALRVGSVRVGKSGGIRAPFQLTPEIFGGVLGRVFDQIYVSRTDEAAYQREVEQAEKQKKLPAYTGETVLRGEITGPVVKQASGSEGG